MSSSPSPSASRSSASTDAVTKPSTNPSPAPARAALAELIGTFILVLVGTAVVTAAALGQETAGPAYDSLAIALAFGLTLTALVAAIGHVSGCHVNPAVTIGLAVIGQFPWKRVPVYIAAQLAGAVGAAFTLWATYGDRARTQTNLGATAPADGVSDLQTFLIEVVIGFILVFVVVATTTDRVPAAAAPLAIGFALAAGVLIAGPISGGAANPARALGPMIVALDFPSFFAYVAGPLIGGIIGALAYAKIFNSTSPPTTQVTHPRPNRHPDR